jgi:uncharacterized protein YndB with AHSA1/START domain
MLDPIVKTIEVPCDQAKAFKIFVSEMSTWWPLDKFTVSAMGGAPIRVDARPGGEIVEIGPDNTEHLWGAIQSYEPNDFISMSFHIPRPGYAVSGRSLVEVRFTVLEEKKTRVVLTQSNWEAFGDSARDMMGGYGHGWAMIFERAYKAACGG